MSKSRCDNPRCVCERYPYNCPVHPKRMPNSKRGKRKHYCVAAAWGGYVVGDENDPNAIPF